MVRSVDGYTRINSKESDFITGPFNMYGAEDGESEAPLGRGFFLDK